MTSAISGRKCLELSTKSGPLGSLVKMLLESEQWWSNAGLLTWEVKPLCSKRVVEFTDTQQNSPLPLNASAKILNQLDIQSSRCLFRLALSVRLIEGIESSSSQIMLQTPSTREVCESPESMQSRKERNGYQNGTKYNGLMSQLMHDPKCSHLLPTPTCNDAVNQSLPKSQAERNDSLVKRILKGELGVSIPKKDGHPFRLSPLFTEEMMGFPLMWTSFPFLLEDGEPNQ